MAAGLLVMALLAPGCSSPAPPASASRSQTPLLQSSPTPAAAEVPLPPNGSLGRKPQIAKFTAPEWNYRVIQRYPHDPAAFTQGLLVGPDGFLYESTGLEGRSQVRQVMLTSGEVKRSVQLPPEYFGEGLALFGERLIQLTWQNHKALSYSFKTFQAGTSWTYSGEGWGLTRHDDQLVMSDGSDRLVWRSPRDFRELKSISVRDGEEAVGFLNELESIEGDIWANVWQSDYIAVIDPASGRVKAWLDLRGLLSSRLAAQADVLNGIAYDAKSKRIFVTGKLWPTLFEIEVRKP